MTLQQQIIESEVEKLMGTLPAEKDIAFLRFSHSLVTGTSVIDFDEADIVDGGQDKQIDVLTFEERSNETVVYVIQSSFTNSFSSNKLIQMKNGLHWLFNRSRSDLDSLSNVELRDKILEYRSIQSAIGPSNILVRCFFVTNGDTSQIADEFEQELEGVRSEYGGGIFSEFTIDAIGCRELVDLIKRYERTSKKIDADIRIVYDANNPSLIKYHSEELKGLVVSVPASEIATIVNADPYGYVFDLNIRRFLGSSGAVNRAIQDTATSEASDQFWYLNNGVTIVCDHFDAVTDPDNPKVKVKNLQIVNGCQTASTLARSQKDGSLRSNVRVLTRIYESQDPSLVSRIVLTTNNQNTINNRNLHSNDEIQKDLARRFEQLGFTYERTPKEHDYAQVPRNKIVSNELVGQAYLAIVLKKPSDARGRKYKIWGEHYHRIFQSHSVEPYVYGYLLLKEVERIVKSRTKLKSSKSEIVRKIAKNGLFHLARIVAYLSRESDSWTRRQPTIAEEIAALPDLSEHYVDQAIDLLKATLQSTKRLKDDVDNALKSYDLDDAITKRLHKTPS